MARSKLPKQSQAQDTRVSNASSMTVTAFHPTLPLYATAALELNGWSVRIVDSRGTQVRSTYDLADGQSCLCLAWSDAEQTASQPSRRKKRKAGDQETNAIREGVLAVGVSDGTVLLLSPAEDEPLAKLGGAHTAGVTGLAFEGERLWSVAGDGKAVCWSVATRAQAHTIDFKPDTALTAVAASGSDVVVGSYKVYQASRTNDERLEYTNHASPVHRLVVSPDGTAFVSAAEGDRYMNVFSLSSKRQVKTLIAEAAVKTVASDGGLLAVLTTDNVVELYADVYASAGDTDAGATKGKRRKSQITTSQGKIRVMRPSADSAIPVPQDVVELMDITLKNDELTIAWTEGTRLVFESVSLRTGDDLDLSTRDIVRAMKPLVGHARQSTDLPKSKQVFQDGHAVVASGQDTGALEADEAGEETTVQTALSSEPTMAERLKLLEISSRSVPEQKVATAGVPMPAVSSLTTVLTQALRSNDVAMLESCFEHRNPDVILETVKRLDPTIALTLLEQLAARLSKKPNRAGELGTWIRWTVVVHGGYLSSLPNLMRSLTSLHGVLSTRAQQLPRLLALQGRLDMVQAQIELRKEGSKIRRRQVLAEPRDVDYNEAESDEDAMAEDLSEDDDDEEEDDDVSEDEADAGGETDSESAESDFSADDTDGGKIAKLDAQMELGHSSDSDDESADDDDGEDDDR